MDYPPIDVDHALKLLSEGAPTELFMSSTYKDLHFREKYNNHPPLAPFILAVLKK
jgi:hypothetical protein